MIAVDEPATVNPVTVGANVDTPAQKVAERRPTAPAGPFKYIKQENSPGGRRKTPLLSGRQSLLLSEHLRPSSVYDLYVQNFLSST